MAPDKEFLIKKQKEEDATMMEIKDLKSNTHNTLVTNRTQCKINFKFPGRNKSFASPIETVLIRLITLAII